MVVEVRVVAVDGDGDGSITKGQRGSERVKGESVGVKELRRVGTSQKESERVRESQMESDGVMDVSLIRQLQNGIFEL